MSTMKFSAPDWCFRDRSGLEPQAYYERLLAIGVDAVELLQPESWPAARAAGIHILNVNGHPLEYGFNRREQHAELLPRVRDRIALAAENGIKWVLVFSGNRKGQDDAAGHEACRAGFEQLLPDAAKAGVVLLFEMLSDHDHPDYHFCQTRHGVDLAAALDSPHFRLVYDIYHLTHGGEDPVADIRAHHGWFDHLHTAQTPNRTMLTAGGDIDWRGCVAAAQAAGYTGHWGLEFKVPAGVDPFAQMQASMAVLRGES